jgi:hypothetical protein
MASRTFNFALAVENSPYIIAPAVSINWFLFFRNLAPVTTVNATLAWLFPVIISTAFAAFHLFFNYEGKNGSRILFNLPFCSKSEYKKKICRALQSTSCAVTVTLPITLTYTVSVQALVSVLKPYDPLVMEPGEGDSIFEWIFIWGFIALITFAIGLPTLLFWEKPKDEIKAALAVMNIRRAEREKWNRVSKVNIVGPDPVSGHRYKEKLLEI